MAGFQIILPFFVSMNLADCYRLLGLRSGAPFEEIKAAYRRLARRYHPDVNPGNYQQSQEKFIQLTEAYKTLIAAVSPDSAAATSPPARSAQASGGAASVKVTRKRPQIHRNPNLSEEEHKLKQGSYAQLQLLLKEQRFPRAIALAEGLAQRIPHDPEVRQWQAIAYQRWGRHLVDQKQLDKARLYLKKALRTDPHNRSLWSEVERDFRRMEKIY